MSIEEKVFAQIDKVEYISFDIFDTLLFRMVRSPERIAEKMFHKKPTLFPEYLTVEDWVELRHRARSYAAADGKPEVSLKEIYDKLPAIIENRNELMNLEVECERDNCYINPEIEEVIYELSKKYNKKIILISDMYLSSDILAGILEHNGFDLNIISNFFVSCDYGVTKRNGDLFKLVTESLGCSSDKILHIGDNCNGDLIKAKKAGVRAIYYPVVSEWFGKYPYLAYEEELYGNISEKNHCLRLLAAAGAEKYDSEGKIWFEIGAMIFGPLVTEAAKWVIDVAEENNISNVLPMMREGKFLSEMLEKEKTFRGWNGQITPFYISRKALYPALLSVIKDKDIMYCLTTRMMTVRALFELLGREIPEEIIEYADVEIIKSEEFFINKQNLNDWLIDYLCNEDVLGEIREKNQGADSLIYQYFSKLGMTDGDYLTFDVGWRGNAQNAIQRIMNKHNVKTKGIHLLINGKGTMLQERNLEDGCDIRGFTSNFGGADAFLRKINIPIFEMFFMCDEGTTIGYEKNETTVLPILKNINYYPEQLEAMHIVQKGMMYFQDLSFKLRAKGIQINEIAPKELLAIVTRLFDKPTKKEAEMIGKMCYDQNFGVDDTWQIISKRNLCAYQKKGYCEYISSKEAREDEWYQGMDAILNPLYSYITFLSDRRKRIKFKYCLYGKELEKIEEDFVLVGAGLHIKDVMGLLTIMNKDSLVEVIIDGNESLEGELICGKKVQSYSYKPKSNIFVITVRTPGVSVEISKQLKNLYGENIKIYFMR